MSSITTVLTKLRGPLQSVPTSADVVIRYARPDEADARATLGAAGLEPRAARRRACLEDKDLAPKTIRNVVATLSALFNFAMGPRRRWAAPNPCQGSTSRLFARHMRSGSS